MFEDVISLIRELQDRFGVWFNLITLIAGLASAYGVIAAFRREQIRNKSAQIEGQLRELEVLSQEAEKLKRKSSEHRSAIGRAESEISELSARTLDAAFRRSDAEFKDENFAKSIGELERWLDGEAAPAGRLAALLAVDRQQQAEAAADATLADDAERLRQLSLLLTPPTASPHTAKPVKRDA